MSDIVERLRQRACSVCGGDCSAANPSPAYCPKDEDKEAADKINDLRSKFVERTCQVAINDFEIERLRAEVAELNGSNGMLLRQASNMEAERDRLRAEKDDIRAELTNLQIAFENWKVVHSTIQKDVEIIRLRELLRSLKSVVMEDYRHLIDAALGEADTGKEER